MTLSNTTNGYLKFRWLYSFAWPRNKLNSGEFKWSEIIVQSFEESSRKHLISCRIISKVMVFNDSTIYHYSFYWPNRKYSQNNSPNCLLNYIRSDSNNDTRKLFQNLFAQYPSNKGRTTRFMPLIKEIQHGKDDEVLTPSSHEIANP